MSKKLIFLYFLTVLAVNANGQLVADFTADKFNGCPTLSVQLTDQSTGTVTNRLWDLGNTNSSVLANPVATYSNPGTYTVTLTVSNNTETKTISKTITVFAPPKVAIDAEEKNGCVPFLAKFLDASTDGDAPIDQWEWDFKTGSIETTQNPTINYIAAKKYAVSLQVTDTNGCSGFADSSDFIDVISQPTASFNYTPFVACEVPTTVTFTNTSTDASHINYKWYFGNGDSSVLKDPQVTYSDFGNYNIELNVNSSYGCSAKINITYSVSDINSQGYLMQAGDTIRNNDTICHGTINYSSTSAVASPVLWQFSDAGASMLKTGTVSFNSGGNKTILLITAPGNPCADTISWDVYIDKPEAAFSQDIYNTCATPVLVSFTNNSENATSYEWKFNDGKKSFSEDTVYTYQLPYDDDEYQVNNTVNFMTTLTAISRHGCTDQTINALSITKPTAQFIPDIISGCAPLTVNFKDLSESQDEINNYNWIFGDLNSINVNEDSVTHIYNTSGEFEAQLVITNITGCTDSSYTIEIVVGEQLYPFFSLDKDTICANGQLIFTDQTPNPSLIDSWTYAVEDINIPSSLTEPNPVWAVKNFRGDVDISLSVNYNGCISDTTLTDRLFIKGPVSEFTYGLDCSDPFQINFNGLLNTADSLKWLFGDGTFNNLNLSPLKMYPTEDNYFVNYITYKSGCSDTSAIELKIREPKARIYGDTAVCNNASITFYADSSYSFSQKCDEKFLWDFGDNSQIIRSSLDSIQHTYALGGVYATTLVAFYENGCTDTAAIDVKVFQPNPGFYADTLLGCTPFTVLFTDTTTDGDNPIVSRIWNFDDGITDTLYVDQDTISHLFANTGEHEVVLTVTDDIGCNFSFSTIVATANPSADFYAISQTKACLGDTIKLGFTYPEPDSAVWNFGNGDILRDTSNVVAYYYDTPGMYQVSLKMYKYGCSDSTKTGSSYINIEHADATFTTNPDSVLNCQTEYIEFTHTPHTGDTIGVWNFGDPENSLSQYYKTRSFRYDPGIYSIHLSVNTLNGCSDEFSKQIEVRGPQANIGIDKTTACPNEHIEFILTDPANLRGFEWDFGDGSKGNTSPVNHAYQNMGNITAFLKVWGDTIEGTNKICEPPADTVLIRIYEILADFNIENNVFCDNDVINFTDLSTGNTSNFWIFGSAGEDTAKNPERSFSPGDYNIELIVRNDENCFDTTQQLITINPLPGITIMEDTIICVGDNIKLFASGGDIIDWTSENEQSISNLYNPVFTPESSLTYFATITDTVTNCVNKDSAFVFVQLMPVVTVNPMPYDTLIIGESTILESVIPSGVNFSWSPDYEISCLDCPNPEIRPIVTTNYTLRVNDTNNCFTVLTDINMVVQEKYSVYIPDIFSPNGDGENDEIFVKGWGIKTLLEFKIYNRWGNLVFQTDDINTGWDGTFKGKKQNTDTYVYTVVYEQWDGQTLTSNGTITLIR